MRRFWTLSPRRSIEEIPQILQPTRQGFYTYDEKRRHQRDPAAEALIEQVEPCFNVTFHVFQWVSLGKQIQRLSEYVWIVAWDGWIWSGVYSIWRRVRDHSICVLCERCPCKYQVSVVIVVGTWWNPGAFCIFQGVRPAWLMLRFGHMRMGPLVDSLQKSFMSGWILWLMVDIIWYNVILLMDVIGWG